MQQEENNQSDSIWANKLWAQSAEIQTISRLEWRGEIWVISRRSNIFIVATLKRKVEATRKREPWHTGCFSENVKMGLQGWGKKCIASRLKCGVARNSLECTFSSEGWQLVSEYSQEGIRAKSSAETKIGAISQMPSVQRIWGELDKCSMFEAKCKKRQHHANLAKAKQALFLHSRPPWWLEPKSIVFHASIRDKLTRVQGKRAEDKCVWKCKQVWVGYK